MKMIKPIVNISKIINDYRLIILGYNGVIFDGSSFYKDAVTALSEMHKSGRNVVLLTNSSKRISEIANELKSNHISLNLFDAIMSAGEILHHYLKNKIGNFANIGDKYFCICADKDKTLFNQLDYKEVFDIAKADFIYLGQNFSSSDNLEKFLPDLQYAASLSIPLICAGNDSSCFINGEIGLGSGAVAEQYAVLGGKIITIGKPDTTILQYCLEDFPQINKDEILLIGDNLQTDIKAANLIGISSALISKGIHMFYLGEGYIPDVAKTRELATNFEVYPDFAISNLRW